MNADSEISRRHSFTANTLICWLLHSSCQLFNIVSQVLGAGVFWWYILWDWFPVCILVGCEFLYFDIYMFCIWWDLCLIPRFWFLNDSLCYCCYSSSALQLLCKISCLFLGVNYLVIKSVVWLFVIGFPMWVYSNLELGSLTSSQVENMETLLRTVMCVHFYISTFSNFYPPRILSPRKKKDRWNFFTCYRKPLTHCVKHFVPFSLT